MNNVYLSISVLREPEQQEPLFICSFSVLHAALVVENKHRGKKKRKKAISFNTLQDVLAGMSHLPLPTRVTGAYPTAAATKIKMFSRWALDPARDVLYSEILEFGMVGLLPCNLNKLFPFSVHFLSPLQAPSSTPHPPTPGRSIKRNEWYSWLFKNGRNVHKIIHF